MDDDTVSKIHDFEASDLPERIKFALRFTERWVAAHSAGINEELLPAMREHFTDEEIVELAYIVGRYDVAHRFNHAFGIERAEDDRYTFARPRITERMALYLEELKQAKQERLAAEG